MKRKERLFFCACRRGPGFNANNQYSIESLYSCCFMVKKLIIIIIIFYNTIDATCVHVDIIKAECHLPIENLK